MSSNTLTMILVLGGTLVGAMALLYLSLLTGAPPRSARNRKKTAEAVTTAMIATRGDSDSSDR